MAECDSSFSSAYSTFPSASTTWRTHANHEPIGHFRITFRLFFKEIPSAYSFIRKLAFIFMWMKNIFHWKGWALRLAFKNIGQWCNGNGLLFYNIGVILSNSSFSKSIESLQHEFQCFHCVVGKRQWKWKLPRLLMILFLRWIQRGMNKKQAEDFTLS